MYISDDFDQNRRLSSSHFGPDDIHSKLHRIIDTLSENDSDFLLELLELTTRSDE